MGMPLAVLFIASSSVFLLQAAIAQEDDFTVPQYVQRKELVNRTSALLNDKNWDELEKIAAELRTKKLRFPSGRWKLETFYRGLADPKEHAGPRDWNSFFAGVQEWKTAKPDSVTPLIVLGEGYRYYGWGARGGGYANKVTDDGWRLFKERLAKAREYLEAAEKMPTKDPEAYCRLLEVALSQGWSRADCEVLFHKAVQIEPAYHDTYLTMAFFLLPRWGGKPGDAERFAEEAAELCKEEGNAMYARIAWYLSAFVGIDQFFEKSSFSWPRMREGFQQLQKLYPKSLRNMTAFCMFACVAQDGATARELFSRMGDKWDQEVWCVYQKNYLQCKELSE